MNHHICGMIRLLPNDALVKLEYDRVIQELTSYCLGDPGRSDAERLLPETNFQIIRIQLNEVWEFYQAEMIGSGVPFTAYQDVSHVLNMLGKAGFVMSLEDLQALRSVISLTSTIFSYFNPDTISERPYLFSIIRDIDKPYKLEKMMDKILDEEGNMRPNATKTLSQIFNKRQSKSAELSNAFRKLVHAYKGRDWLVDSIESLRNGRRVLAVKSEYKRRVRGIIHDESTTGKTAFVEPEEVIGINNDLFDLDIEKKKEIHRILAEVSTQVADHLGLVTRYSNIIRRFDLIQAKSRLARSMNAVKPKVSDSATLNIVKGYHPVLWLKNQKSGQDTVPMTLQLMSGNRILLLSGPNAGGKSVAMKCAGLLQLMVQSGMLIPVSEETEMGIFHSIFADIGDQQSLEEDLSTYSSHLVNMRTFIEAADDRTLVLIDEFGSGTDPKIGGAIAESILDRINKTKAFGVITTHYSNLKVFAFKNKGIVNGAMLFDQELLKPTFELKVGKPGSSFAFDIASKIGLDKKIIASARKKTGQSESGVEDLLVSLQNDKMKLEEQLDAADMKNSKLDKLIRNYERLKHELDIKRKKFNIEQKERKLENQANENRAFEQLIRELREGKKLEEAKALAKQLREDRMRNIEQLQKDQQEIRPEKQSTEPLKVGDQVRIISGNVYGQVESMSRDKAEVLVGSIRMKVALSDLEKSGETLTINSKKSVSVDMISHQTLFNNRLDLRGMRKAEALQVLQEFLDASLMASSTTAVILHGKGDGILRQVVKQKLKEYDHVVSSYHPKPEEGGEGITIVEMK